MIAIVLALVVQQELTEKTYEKLRDEILPRKEELRWLDIPWQITLWDAVIEAQKQDKPILFYAMNGHPLACT